MSCWVHRFLMIGLTLEFKCRAEGRGLDLWAVGGTEGAGSRAVYWLGLSFVEDGQGAAPRFSQLLLMATQKDWAPPGFKPRP